MTVERPGRVEIEQPGRDGPCDRGERQAGDVRCAPHGGLRVDRDQQGCEPGWRVRGLQRLDQHDRVLPTADGHGDSLPGGVMTVPCGQRGCWDLAKCRGLGHRTGLGFHLHLELKWHLQAVRHREFAQALVVQVVDES